ncbi:hypothetical protein VTK56DRAFT_2862 [Thermocarpiscus australiensis]
MTLCIWPASIDRSAKTSHSPSSVKVCLSGSEGNDDDADSGSDCSCSGYGTTHQRTESAVSTPPRDAQPTAQRGTRPHARFESRTCHRSEWPTPACLTWGCWIIRQDETLVAGPGKDYAGQADRVDLNRRGVSGDERGEGSNGRGVWQSIRCSGEGYLGWRQMKRAVGVPVSKKLCKKGPLPTRLKRTTGWTSGRLILQAVGDVSGYAVSCQAECAEFSDFLTEI